MGPVDGRADFGHNDNPEPKTLSRREIREPEEDCPVELWAAALVKRDHLAALAGRFASGPTTDQAGAGGTERGYGLGASPQAALPLRVGTVGKSPATRRSKPRGMAGHQPLLPSAGNNPLTPRSFVPDHRKRAGTAEASGFRVLKPPRALLSWSGTSTPGETDGICHVLKRALVTGEFLLGRHEHKIDQALRP